MCLWKVLDWTLIRKWMGHDEAASCAVFNSDGSLLVSCGYDKCVAVHRVPIGILVGKYDPENSRLFSLALTHGGKYLVVRHDKGSVKMLDFEALLESFEYEQ